MPDTWIRMRTISLMARISVLTLGVGAMLVFSAPVARAECGLLDLSCLTEAVEEVTGVVDETVDGVTGVVEETVDGVTGVVKESVNGGLELVEDTVDSVTGLVDDTVKDAPKPVTDPIDDVIRSDDPPVPVSPGAGDEPAPKPGADRPRAERPATRPATGEAASSTLSDAQLERNAVVPAPRNLPSSERPGLLERIGEAAGVAARQLTFPLGLSLIVVTFVLFQNYLDRKDPKLAVAPIAAEVLKFE